jgi:hypothetical protein
MGPVLHQVRHQNNGKKRHKKWQVLHPALNAVFGGPTEQLVDQEVGCQKNKTHHHVVDDEVVEVRLPFGPKDGLILAQGK